MRRRCGAGYGVREGLAASCERALVAGARRHCADTRQQLRASARRFVRRHRRDAGYLRWVLRSVTASSALAVALLGLGSAPAAAELAPFANQGTSFYTGLSVGTQSALAPGDLDGDGDIDAIAGSGIGTFAWLENTGSAVSPAIAMRTGVSNPLDGQDVGAGASPALGDLDADGDLDLVAGRDDGGFSYFENTGTATSPGFSPRTGLDNPLDGLDVGTFSTPALRDLDGDGDLDLVAGADTGGFFYLENTGTATSPAFALRSGAANPLEGEDVGGFSTPALGDLDGDGDLDLVAGESSGQFFIFENTGSVTSPAFAARTGASNPLVSFDVGFLSHPALGDLDGDGDLDIHAGDSSGVFRVFENRAGGLVQRPGSSNPLNGQDVGTWSAPALGDLDGDGDLDLVSGQEENYGAFLYFENVGNATGPVFVQRTGGANPLAGQPITFRSAPALGDLDGDGDLDLVSGDGYGLFWYFENTGSAGLPAFELRTGAANPLAGQDVGSRSMPTLGDLDGDGDLDLLSSHQYAAWEIAYFENTGSPASPAFVQRTGTANPFFGVQFGSFGSPSLGDLDGDSDLDLYVGDQAAMRYFENTGGATSPAFAERSDAAYLAGSRLPSLGDLDGDGDLDLVAGQFGGTFDYYESFIVQSPPAIRLSGTANPLAGQDVGSLSAPALADLDRDGDADLLTGEDFGALFFIENTGEATQPAFAPRTGAANPLNGADVGDAAKPAFADLDGDGDFDLLVGRLAGDFDYFENTGDARTPLFASALANPFGLAAVDSDAAGPAFGDLDGDGDLDLVVGEGYGTFAYFENTGSRTSPLFLLRSGFANPLWEFDLLGDSTPCLADFDGDGDLDLVAGSTGGRVSYFQNTGTLLAPVFVRLTGVGNPLAGEDLGSASAPACADLDGNGTPDLVTGASSGTFAVHYLPEPGHGLLLGAGIALLGLLGRLRGRPRDTG